MFAVIHLPDFSLQAVLRHEPELWTQSVALVEGGTHPPRLCARTESAARTGVSVPMTPTQAQARCPDLIIRTRSASQEASATDALIQCAYGFTPLVEQTRPGILTLDLGALAELKGADKEQFHVWAARLASALTGHQFRPRIGMGPTPNLAQHAAHWGPPIQIVEQPELFLRQLPVAALHPSSDVATLFSKWGIQTVGELLDLGQAEVTERIGLEAFALFAAASPKATRPLRWVRLPERFEEQYPFDPPLETAEQLLFLLRRWIDQFSQRLEGIGLVAGGLSLRWQLEDGTTGQRLLPLPHPTAQADILFRLLQTFLETLRTDAPLTGVSLALEPARPVHHQFSLFEAAIKDPHQLQETLGRLSALLGPDRVGTPMRQDRHHPDCFVLTPPHFEQAPVPLPSNGSRLPRPLPFRRLRPASMARVETGQAPLASLPEPPHALASPSVSGPIRFSLGPWRQSGEWWENGGWQREEWDVETHRGITCRLVRTAEGWVVTGILD